MPLPGGWGPQAGVAAVPRRVVGRQMSHEKSARGVGGQTVAPGWVDGRTPSHGVVGVLKQLVATAVL